MFEDNTSTGLFGGAGRPTVFRAHGAPTVLVAAGGTGGHIYPGLALARALRSFAPGARVEFLGTRRGLETRLVPEAGYRLHTHDMVPVSRGNLLRSPFALLHSTRRTSQLLADLRVDVAVGMGAYVSAPLIAAARLAGVPALIHESNAVPGRANRAMSRLTRHVAVAHPDAGAHFPRPQDCRTVGMPMGPALARFDRASLREEARARFGIPDGVVHVLVNGGSQGATRINEAAVDLANRWRDRRDVRFLIKAGTEGRPALTERLNAGGGAAVADAVDYLDRMDLAYAAADIAVCRAGSATVAELGSVGLPSVLVPYPHAPHDHQTHNASHLVEAGAGSLLPDRDVSADTLAGQLQQLVSSADRRSAMSAAARALARPDAAERLAEWVLHLAHEEKG